MSSNDFYNLDDPESLSTGYRRDNNPENYEIADDDQGEPGNTDDGDDGGEPSALLVYRRIFRILISPIEGWKNFKRLKLTAAQANRIFLFPIIGFAAIVRMATGMIWLHHDIQRGLTEAIDTFVAFFFSYFCINLCSRLLFPKEYEETVGTDFGKNFVAVALTTLAMFDILYQALPMLQPILVFLPLWTIYIIGRGVRFLGIRQSHQTKVSTILCVLVIGFPILIGWVFSEAF